MALQTGYKVGSEVTLTVDLFSAVGVLILAHADKKVLEEDLNAVREMEKTGLFEFEEEIDPVTYEASPDLNIQRVGGRSPHPDIVIQREFRETDRGEVHASSSGCGSGCWCSRGHLDWQEHEVRECSACR